MQPEDQPVSDGEVVASLSPPRYPFWSWIDLALVVGLLAGMLALVFFAAGSAVLVFPSLKTNQAPLYLPLQVAFYIAIYLAFFFVFHFRYGKPVFETLGWKQTVSPRILIYAGVCGTLLSPAISVIAAAFHTPEVRMDALDQLEKYPVILVLFGIMAVTLAPLFEELLFRGFLQPLFSRTLGVVAGIAITGVLFGLLHSVQYKNVWQYIASVSIVGMVFGAVRYKTGSIIPSTIMHGCFNAVASLGLIFHHK